MIRALPVRRPSVVRRLLGALSLAALVTVLGGLLLAGPASADVPEGWGRPDDVNVVHALLVLGGIPVLLFVAIGLAIYVPSLARGERIAPGAPPVADQWLGGPRKGTAQLAGPDGDRSDAGGAHGRW